MRRLIFFITFCWSFSVLSSDYVVFQERGLYGLKDPSGQITVPPVYEQLGWSDGTTQVHHGVIGFRKNDLWGLITVKNKPVTAQHFYTIFPVASGYFKASIKGKFSNRLFYGILDEKGRTIISFNYFSVEPLGAQWLVSDLSGMERRFGLVSFENRLLIPLQYETIEERNELYFAHLPDGKLDIYDLSGSILQLGIDSISFTNGWIAYRDGYAAFLTYEGALVHDFEYKAIRVSGTDISTENFPKWTVYKADSIYLQWECDSLTIAKDGLLVAHLNGAQHLLTVNKKLLDNHDLELKYVIDDQLIVQDRRSRKWSVLKENGDVLLKEYQKIKVIGDYYAMQNQRGWWLADSRGEIKNRLPFQDIQPGLDGQVMALRNNHWGLLDSQVNELTNFKFDSIVTSNKGYLVYYLNRWGVLDSLGNWVLRPEYQQVHAFDDLLIARKWRGYTYFYQGSLVNTSTAAPVKNLEGYILVKNEGWYGLLNGYGQVIVDAEYDTIKKIENYFELKRGDFISVISTSGQQIIYPEEGYQQLGAFGEGYYSIKKSDKWGFIDDRGRLRISNRYDSVGFFREDRAAIFLRGKWGFIDKKETIKIQPYYDYVTPFEKGRSVVRVGDRYGLIDKEGAEVLRLEWSAVQRLPSGNYLVKSENGTVGLVDENGSFILRPSFDYLADFGDRVLVSKNGAWGILKYSAEPIVKINHSEVRIVGDLTMIKH